MLNSGNDMNNDARRKRGFGKAMGFGLRPALLLIDLVQGFTDPNLPLGSSVDGVIEQANRLIDGARAAKIPVIFSTILYEEAGLEDAGLWVYKIEGLKTLKASSLAVEQDPRLHRLASDSIIKKRYASCFFGTDFATRLQTRGIDTLIMAGCSTSGCVRATAVDACQSGFRPIVAQEAVADRSPSAHAQSLLDIDALYGDVVGVSEVLSYFEAI